MYAFVFATGDIVAHVKVTVLLLANGTVKVTGLDLPAGFVPTAPALPEELQALLAVDEAEALAERRRQKKKASRKKKAGDASGKDEE